MQEFGRPWRIAGAAAWLALMLGGVGFFAHLALTMDGTASALVMLVPILTLALLAVDAARSLGLVARGRLSTRQIAQLSQSDSLFIRGHAIHRRAGRIARRAPTQLGHLIPRLREERRILRDALEQGLANPTAVAIRSVEQVLAPIQEELGEVWRAECIGCGAVGTHAFRHEAGELAAAEHERLREEGRRCADEPQLKQSYLGRHPDERLPRCREAGCRNESFVDGLCQLHYERDRQLASWRPSAVATDRLEGPRITGGDPSMRVARVKEQIGRLRSDAAWLIENPGLFDQSSPESRQLFAALGLWDDRRASTPRKEEARLADIIERLFEEARAAGPQSGDE